MQIEIELSDVEENALNKACFSCKHRKYKSIADYCDIDKHNIGFFELFNQTCLYHELEKGDSDE